MTKHSNDVPNLQQLWQEITQRRTLVLGFATIGLFVGLLAAVITPDRFAASQALVVRNQAGGGDDFLGKFAHSDDRKAVQTAVAALAHHDDVLAKSLGRIGPPQGRSKREYPTPEQVDAAKKLVELRPPNGSDYGQTDIFYLHVAAVGRERAAALAETLAREVQSRYQAVRQEQWSSLIRELEAAERSAEAEVHRSAERIGAIEATVGSDLAELRLLDSTSGGISDLRQNLLQLEVELRDAERNARLMRELGDLLAESNDKTATLVATPSDLLSLQPGLRRIKEALIDAQLKTASLRGSRSERHPDVRAALSTESWSNERLQAEVEVAVAGLGVDLRLAEGRISQLKQQIEDVHRRLGKTAAARAEYHSLTTALQDQTDHLQRVRRELGDLRGAVASAQQAPLLQLIDAPSVSLHPIGLSSKASIAGGLIGGFACGVAWVLLASPVPFRPTQPTSDRETQRKPSKIDWREQWQAREMESRNRDRAMNGGRSRRVEESASLDAVSRQIEVAASDWPDAGEYAWTN